MIECSVPGLWSRLPSEPGARSGDDAPSVPFSSRPQTIELNPQLRHLAAQQLDLPGQTDQGRDVRPSCLIRRLAGVALLTIHEQLAVPRLLAARLAREAGHERVIPVGQRVKRLLRLRDRVERVHPFGPGAQLSHRLRSAQEQNGEQGYLPRGQRK